MKIAIAGVGYVGLSLATLLSQYNEVVALDIIEDKVDKINSKISPIEDKYIEKYLRTKKLNLRATLDYKDAFCNADFIIICMPTNYDEKNNFFDTSLVEEIIEKIKNMKISTTIIIKSTVPVGFTEKMKRKHNMNNIIFSPEFLREGKALYDNLYPSRIILGDKNEQAKKFAELLKKASLKKDVAIKFMKSTEAEAVKLNILNILNQKYDITEADLLSSELEVVPAFKARSLGFDGSMVAAYGQDDKVCAYTSLKAMMSLENVKTTAICILSDKEEIGSMGNTGMESHVFDYFISELLNKTGENRTNLLDKVFCFSKMLSADVDAGFDPLYASVSDRHNAGYLGKGISLNKYTGARGKSGASDANAEFVAWVRRVLEKNDIRYQISELGKVDVGGGGTIAYILANKGVDVIDCGVPVLSMHAPYEVTSKFDIYEAYRAYKAFWNKD